LTVSVVRDDRELYAEYARLLGDQAQLPITVKEGEGLSDRDMGQIEGALRELLAAELVRQGHDQLRANGVSEEFLDERDLPSSLDGVPLPERDQRILEAKVRQLSRRMRQPQDGNGGGLDGPDGGDGAEEPPRRRPGRGWGSIMQASHAPGHVCICMATGIPGTTQSLSSVNPLPPPPPGTNVVTIAVALLVNNIAGPTFSGDTLRLTVEPGTPFGIGSGQMHVGLASAVNWAKEIYAWNLCRGRLATLHQPGPSTTPTFMTLTRACDGADTIVFRKPQFGGVWADVGNFDFTLFWTVFGGRRLTFTWLTD
jgi:hypothetical protein